LHKRRAPLGTASLLTPPRTHPHLQACQTYMLPRIKSFEDNLQWFSIANNVGMRTLARETGAGVLQNLLADRSEIRVDAIMAKMDTNSEMYLLTAVLGAWRRAQARGRQVAHEVRTRPDCAPLSKYEASDEIKTIYNMSREGILALLF
jgi:hypothetical protein